MRRHPLSIALPLLALTAGPGLTACDDDPPPSSEGDPQEFPGEGEGEGPGGSAQGGGEGSDSAPVEGLPESCGAALPHPGPKTLHRLNRAEYDNTVRDLLGDTSGPARDFPADDHGHGFDNQADVLALGPLLAEKYDLAARQLIEDALYVARSEPEVHEFEAEEVGADVGAAYQGFGWNLWSNGEMRIQVVLAEGGDYRISIHAFGQQAGPEPARMQLTFDNVPVQEFDVTATAESPETYTAEIDAEAGSHSLAVAFVNDFYEPDEGLDRNLILDWFEVRGPLTPRVAPNPEARGRILLCEPEPGAETGCARRIFERFGRRAWRRPLSAEELGRLAGFLDVSQDAGGTWEDGVRLGLRAILLSPNFLFRVEVDPDPSDDEAHPLTDHELATRLSYFLWSSMPDEALDAAADAGGLNEPEAVQAQVDRMLADDKARAIIDNFAGQWLFLRALDDLDPDYQKYAEFDEALRTSMRAETEAFFEAFLGSDASALDMLDASFSFVDDRLARHYGLEAPGADEATWTDTLGQGRAGVLTQASILSVTSHRTRTSPVKRGLWVLANLMCVEPPPPPPDVPQLDEPVDPTASLRDRMEQHRADPQCAGCHAIMDPIGFSFEHFDAIGAWRDDDEGFAIDDSGELPGGEAFAGPVELSRILKADPKVPRCIAGKLSTYALGRGEEPGDRCHVDELTQRWASGDHSLKGLLREVALSRDFRMRRGERDAGEVE